VGVQVQRANIYIYELFRTLSVTKSHHHSENHSQIYTLSVTKDHHHLNTNSQHQSTPSIHSHLPKFALPNITMQLNLKLVYTAIVATLATQASAACSPKGGVYKAQQTIYSSEFSRLTHIRALSYQQLLRGSYMQWSWLPIMVI
jgi:hypothetical protein